MRGSRFGGFAVPKSSGATVGGEIAFGNEGILVMGGSITGGEEIPTVPGPCEGISILDNGSNVEVSAGLYDFGCRGL